MGTSIDGRACLSEGGSIGFISLEKTRSGFTDPFVCANTPLDLSGSPLGLVLGQAA